MLFDFPMYPTYIFDVHILWESYIGTFIQYAPGSTDEAGDASDTTMVSAVGDGSMRLVASQLAMEGERLARTLDE